MPRLREYVLALRAIWRCWEDDEPLAFEGEHYQFTLMPPNFKPPRSGLPPARVSLAAVGPAMLRLAGEVCDGVRLHPFCTRRYLERVAMPALDVGLARAGRTRADLEIHGGGFVVTGASDAEVAEHFEFVRQRVAFYGSTRAYFPVWAEHSFEDLGEKLRGMSLRGEWAAMAAEIPDDVVHLFAAVGRHDELTRAVTARFAGLTDSIAISSAAGETALLPASVVDALQRAE